MVFSYNLPIIQLVQLLEIAFFLVIWICCNILWWFYWFLLLLHCLKIAFLKRRRCVKVNVIILIIFKGVFIQNHIIIFSLIFNKWFLLIILFRFELLLEHLLNILNSQVQTIILNGSCRFVNDSTLFQRHLQFFHHFTFILLFVIFFRVNWCDLNDIITFNV